MVVHHNTSSTNAAWLVVVVQGHVVLAVKCLKSSGAIYLATVHSLQRLHKSGTVYPTLCGTLFCVKTHFLSV